VRVICGHTEGKKRKADDTIYLRFQLSVCASESNNNSLIIDLGRHEIAFCASRGDKAPGEKQKKFKFHHCNFSVARFLNRYFSWLLF